MLYDEVETELTHQGDIVDAGGGCEGAVTTKTRCWLANYRNVASHYMEGFL